MVSLPLVIAVQVTADRTALASGKPIGYLLHERWRGRGAAVVTGAVGAHAIASLIVMTADLVAIGVGLELVAGGPPWLWSLGTGVVIAALLVGGSFVVIARVCKVLCLAIAAFVVAAVQLDVSWTTVLRTTFLPPLPGGDDLPLVLGVLGATLPPYVLLWQNLHRLEEMRAEDDAGGEDPLPLRWLPPRAAARRTRGSTLDVICGMTFAVAVMFAVILTNAVGSDGPLGSLEAIADSLRSVAGDHAGRLFGVGIAASGLLALPVLAGTTASAIASSVGRESGFSRAPRDAPLFYVIVVGVSVISTLVSAAGIEPLDLLVLAGTANGLAAAPVLAAVMVVAGDRALLGEHRPGRLCLALGWTAAALLGVCAAAAVVSWL